MNLTEKIHQQYFKYYLVSLSINLVFRIVETVQVYIKFNPKNLLISEGFGLMRDVFIIGLILIILYPLYSKYHERWPHFGSKLTWFIIGIFVLLHIAISEYFFYQLRPLDIFFFKHKPEEMAFSINTAGPNVVLQGILKIFILLLLYFILVVLIERIKISLKINKILLQAYFLNALIFLPIYFFVKLPISSNLSVNKSTFIYTNLVLDWGKSLYGPNMNTMSDQYQKEFGGKEYLLPDYPFLHRFKAEDQLSKYLNNCIDTPNLVIIIVEGLANDFIHPINGIHFMPFLDSLNKNSLYWDHFFSNSERSFGATPSITGSLPFGKIGFALLDQYPYHFSLVNVLKENQFFTSFYYGQGAWFHGKEPFYKFNNIDQIIDKNNFHPTLEKVFIGEENHFWGYNDIDLFRQYFITTDSLKKKLRLDLFFTGTSHAPFALKYPDYYNQKLDAAIENISSAEDKEYFEKYRNYYASLYNVDDAFRYFFNQYSKRPEFQNTIFIITGDHPMTEIPAHDALKKYHVPLIIYSPLLLHGMVFHETASHLDIYETILSYYQKQHQLRVPEVSTALGKPLRFSSNFEEENCFGMMNDNRHIDDFLYNDYFISDDNTMSKLNFNLELKEIYDKINWGKIHKKLLCYRAASLNASVYNKLMPESYYFDFFKYNMLISSKRSGKFSLGINGISLFDLTPVNSKSIYLDLKFKRLEHFNFIPQCVIRIYNSNKTFLKELKYELKTNQEDCQFHIPIVLNSSSDGSYLISSYLINKEKHSYDVSDLETRLYSK